MSEKPYGEMKIGELLAEERKYPFADLRHMEIRSELERRTIIAQIGASEAQTRSTRIQLFVVLIMLATAISTTFFQWLSWAHPH
jgi:hypothetical protein